MKDPSGLVLLAAFTLVQMRRTTSEMAEKSELILLSLVEISSGISVSSSDSAVSTSLA